MATKDSSTGLLARMASLVRNVTPDPAAPTRPEGAEGPEGGKAAIKRMLERKAHNDAIRQREFSQLRKLRGASAAAKSEMVARASYFQDSAQFQVQEERATTLKKIDEIEAQMSKQWWKAQQGETASGPDAPDAPARPATTVTAASSSLSPTLPPPDAPDDTRPSEFAVTQVSQMHASPAAAAASPAPAARQEFASSINSVFSVSKMVSIDMGQALSDPVLEDAAIRFANSDDLGAEAVLLLALKNRDAAAAQIDGWVLALLDLYRGIGQRDSFESLASDYASRLNRLRRSVKTAVPPEPLLAPEAHHRSAGASASGWQCPAVLDRVAVERLCDRVNAGRALCVLDWSHLKGIVPEAAQALAEAVGVWCDQPLNFQFDGLQALEDQLLAHTPVGQPDVAPFWWQLRLNLLRALALQEEFELASMDYCVTYEVSPPPWVAPRCLRTYGRSLAAEIPDTQRGEPEHVTTLAMPLAGQEQGVSDDARRVALSGQVLGTVAPQLQALQAALKTPGDLRVDCTELIRVDFSAAGSILNALAIPCGPPRRIEFSEAPRLVAAFFNLIGINEHAQIVARCQTEYH